MGELLFLHSCAALALPFALTLPGLVPQTPLALASLPVGLPGSVPSSVLRAMSAHLVQRSCQRYLPVIALTLHTRAVPVTLESLYAMQSACLLPAPIGSLEQEEIYDQLFH